MTGPALSASPATGPLGGALTVTLTNWSGGGADWVTMAPVGSANTTYGAYVYASTLPGTGSTRTWTTTIPAAPGTYEVRLFPNNGYTRAATSNPITAVAPPAPILSGITPASVTVGSDITLTATGQSFVSTSVVQINGIARTTTFGGSTSLSVTVPASDLPGGGNLSITVATPAPCAGTTVGACVSAAQPVTVIGPSLTVNTTNVVGGQPVTVTLANGYGNAFDWLAIAPTGTPGSYFQWIYVGAGTRSRTWTVTMPTTAGQYEFRLYLNNGFATEAVSPAVTVVTP